MTLPPAAKARKLRAAFRKFDINGDGVLSFEEIREGLRAAGGGGWGKEINPRQLGKVMAALDENGDGSVDYEEFAACVAKGAPQPRGGHAVIHQESTLLYVLSHTTPPYKPPYK